VKLVAFGLAVLIAVPASAGAQGRGNGRPKQPQATVQGTSATAAPAVGPNNSAVALIRFPQFGSWLDDASTPAAGAGTSSVGVAYWRGAAATQLDAPILSVTYGVSDRFQFGATVPFYRATYQDATVRGLDDVYLSAKVAGIDPAVNGHFGVAIGSILEILSTARDTGQRVHWAVPLSVEARGGPLRLYGSTGYFSRGALFAGGALEWTASSGTSVTGALAESISAGDDAMTGTGVARRITDFTVSVAQPITSVAALYVAAGRTLMNAQMGGAATSFAAGVSFSFSRPAASP
jgi:hypothetical protein